MTPHNREELIQTEALLAAEKRVLELIATGAPLAEVLHVLCENLEDQSEQMLCSILLLDSAGKHLRLGAAPSLRDSCRELVDGIAVGPSVGPCGTAAYLAQQVIVADLATDPLWANYRDVALNHGLRACWCTPVFSTSGKVLGTLAMYCPEPRQPVRGHLLLIERATHLAAIAIERNRAEEALRASEVKYRSLTENLEQCIYLKDSELRYVAANQPFCRSLGRAESDIVGKTDLELYPPHLAAKYQADDRRVLGHGRRLELEEQNLVSGQLRTVRVVKTPAKDGQGRIVGALGIFWDVTEQRLLEAKVRQVQKMEAVGQLAGGVAHDFNNLLTVILGNVSLLRARRAPEDPDDELLSATEKAALRAAELTSKLLGFSRRTGLRLVETNLNACIEETVMILRRTIDPAIAIEVDTAPHLWKVEADASQMNQVLMNLCLNARDAMPCGGCLRLETSNGVLDEEYARLHLEARPGEFVRLRVEDTGHGMSPEVRQRIFEPFYTTKEPGKGTGLGLAMVFGIIKQHQGWIDCYSEVNRGTRFDIYLPHYYPSPKALADPAAAEPLTAGHGTILLVDDEPMIRNLGQNILQSYGYQVLLAEDGQKALGIYRRHQHLIDLVILDLTMPGLSGRDAYEQLLRIDPEVRVLLASGHAAEQITQVPSARILGFLPKPYRPEELARAVRASLDEQQGSGIADPGSGI